MSGINLLGHYADLCGFSYLLNQSVRQAGSVAIIDPIERQAEFVPETIDGGESDSPLFAWVDELRPLIRFNAGPAAKLRSREVKRLPGRF